MKKTNIENKVNFSDELLAEFSDKLLAESNDTVELMKENFVATVRMMYNLGMTVDQILDCTNYDQLVKDITTTMFGTEDIWKSICQTYPEYFSMLYTIWGN